MVFLFRRVFVCVGFRGIYDEFLKVLVEDYMVWSIGSIVYGVFIGIVYFDFNSFGEVLFFLKLFLIWRIGVFERLSDFFKLYSKLRVEFRLGYNMLVSVYVDGLWFFLDY